LIAIDARVRVADRFAGPLSDAPYFGNYALIAAPQRAALGDVDDEPVVVLLEQRDGEWTPRSVVLIDAADHGITRIADYWHTPWILDAATVS